MRNYHVKKTDLKEYTPTINVEHLWSLVGNEMREHYKNDKNKRAPVIDVLKHGFFKVLGKGVLPDQPVIVKARFFSKNAEEKIKNAGGACVLTA